MNGGGGIGRGGVRLPGHGRGRSRRRLPALEPAVRVDRDPEPERAPEVDLEDRLRAFFGLEPAVQNRDENKP